MRLDIYCWLLVVLALSGCKSQEEEIKERTELLENMKMLAQLEEGLAKANAEENSPVVGSITKENARNGCKVYVDITPMASGFEHRIDVQFKFKSESGGTLHMMPWTINRPVAHQVETIKGWWHGHPCDEVANVEVTARAR